ncbi:hypothetical protein MPER_02798, partial [Moniliophthora perniciosa FA553]
SDTIIKKLILFTVNTGALTSLCAVASLRQLVSCHPQCVENSIRTSADNADYNTTSGIFGGVGATSGGVGTRGTKGSSIQIKTTQEFVTDASSTKEKKSQGSIADEMEMTRVNHNDNSDSEASR